MRTRILSDLHLGHSASRIVDPEMLSPLFEGIDHLVLAGDIWQQRKVGGGLEEAKRLFERLLAMLEERDISVELLRGNHDPKGGLGVAWLADRRVLVTHGDAVYEDATPWSREMGTHREEIDAIVEKYRSQSHFASACADRATEIALTIRPTPLPKLPPPLNFFATAVWPPRRLFEMIRVWRGMGAQGLKFLHESGEGARVLVCGHFHQAGFWGSRGDVVINTGSFMKGSRTWVVDVEEENLTARTIRLEGGAFIPGEVKGRWRLPERKNQETKSDISTAW